MEDGRTLESTTAYSLQELHEPHCLELTTTTTISAVQQAQSFEGTAEADNGSSSCSEVSSNNNQQQQQRRCRRVLPPVPSTPPSLSPLRHLYRSARETLLRANPALAHTFHHATSSSSTSSMNMIGLGGGGGGAAAGPILSPSLSSTPFSPMKLQRRLESLAAAVHQQQQQQYLPHNHHSLSHNPPRQSSVDRVGYDFATNSDAANSPVPSIIGGSGLPAAYLGSLSPATRATSTTTFQSVASGQQMMLIRQSALQTGDWSEQKERESVHLRYLHSLLGSSRECVSRLEAGASRESLTVDMNSSKLGGGGGGRWSSPLSSGYQSQRSRDSFERPEESYNEYLELTERAAVASGEDSGLPSGNSQAATSTTVPHLQRPRRRSNVPPLEHLDSMDIVDSHLDQLLDLQSAQKQPPPPPPKSPFELDPLLSREFTVGVLAILLADPRNLNLVYSPYCLQTVLAMLVPGAGGRTQDELLMALFEAPYESPLLMMGKFVAMNRRICARNVDCLLITSGLYVDERLRLEPAYTDLLRREFGVTAKAINFRDRTNACHLVNCDTNEATDGLIGEVLQPCHLQRCPPPVSPLTLPLPISSTSPLPGGGGGGSSLQSSQTTSSLLSSVVLISTALLRATWHPSYPFIRRQRPFFSAEYFFGGHRRKPPTPTSMLLQTCQHPFVHDARLGIRAVQLNLAPITVAPSEDGEQETNNLSAIHRSASPANDEAAAATTTCKVAMVLFLADSEQTPLGSLLRSSLSGDNLDYLLESLAPATVDLRMPEFHLDFTFEMVDQLRCLGMVDVFSQQRADLRPMLMASNGNGTSKETSAHHQQKPNTVPAVTAVLQRVIVEVDLAGDGTGGSQPWAGGGHPSKSFLGHRGGPSSLLDPMVIHRFYADRPFLFALVTTDTPRKEVLFMGAINDPTV